MATRSFEQALADLEQRVARLEKGELPLEDALRIFEEGVALVRECHETLDAADARIAVLTDTSSGIQEAPLPGGGAD
jgi:exodeoxyribonuclease VII small subunit